MRRQFERRQLKPVLKMAIVNRQDMSIRFVDRVSFLLALEGLCKIKIQIYTEVDEHEHEVAAR